MAKQVGKVIFTGTSLGANGYITREGKVYIRRKPGPRRELWKRAAVFARSRSAAELFGEVASVVGAFWRWMPKEMRRLGDPYAYQRLVAAYSRGMQVGHPLSPTGLEPVHSSKLYGQVQRMTGMDLTCDHAQGEGVWLHGGEGSEDLGVRSSRLPQKLAVEGLGDLVALALDCGVAPEALRVRVHIYMGELKTRDQRHGGLAGRSTQGAWMPLTEELGILLEWSGLAERHIGLVVGLEFGYVVAEGNKGGIVLEEGYGAGRKKVRLRRLRCLDVLIFGGSWMVPKPGNKAAKRKVGRRNPRRRVAGLGRGKGSGVVPGGRIKSCRSGPEG